MRSEKSSWQSTTVHSPGCLAHLPISVDAQPVYAYMYPLSISCLDPKTTTKNGQNIADRTSDEQDNKTTRPERGRAPRTGCCITAIPSQITP